MKFVNEVNVQTPADELFGFLSDVERVAPCLPGARIDGREGDDYRGSMKVKIGPITGMYEGTLRFLELDDNRRRAVLSARANETAGQGSAEARIETEISEADGGSQLRMVTDLQLQGRVAQFGRGAIERISQRMFSEFARNIEQRLAAGGNGAPTEPDHDDRAQKSPAPRAAHEESGHDDSLDALGLVTGPLVAKVGPLLLSAAIGFGYGYLLGRLRERTR
jgi:carbon monoxide dehydrogenase subunit G